MHKPPGTDLHTTVRRSVRRVVVRANVEGNFGIAFVGMSVGPLGYDCAVLDEYILRIISTGYFWLIVHIR
jgi:hypothetical protein